MYFDDRGLHLAVLGALIDAGALDEKTIAERLAAADLDPEPRYRVKDAIFELVTLPLPDEAVAAVTSLDFDGGNTIYGLIERAIDVDTGGETDDYELRSLAGVGALRALTRLDLDGHGYRAADLDLAPLAAHPALADVRLSGHCVNAAALASLPALAKLDVRHATLDDDALPDRLAARGVVVVRH